MTTEATLQRQRAGLVRLRYRGCDAKTEPLRIVSEDATHWRVRFTLPSGREIEALYRKAKWEVVA